MHSKDVTLVITRDSFLRGHRVIDLAAQRIREERANYPLLSAYFKGSVTFPRRPRKEGYQLVDFGIGKTGNLLDRPLRRNNALDMVKRRATTA